MERKLVILMKILLVGAALWVVLLLGYTLQQDKKHNQPSDLQKIEFIGNYQPEGVETWKSWRPGDSVNNILYASVTFQGHFYKNIPENKKLHFYICHIGMELYQNGQLIGTLGRPQDLPPGAKTAGNGWLSFTSPGIKATDEITIRLFCSSKGNVLGLYDYLMNEIYMGDTGELFMAYMPSEGMLIVLGAVIVLMALGMSVVWMTLRLLKVPMGSAPLYLAFFMLSLGVWLMLFTGIITLLIPYNIGLSLMYTIFSGLCGLFFLLYILDFIHTKKSRLFLMGIGYMVIVQVVICTFLQATGRIDGYEASQTFLLSNSIIMIVCILLTVQMVRGKKMERNWHILPVICVFGVCELVELINYLFPLVPDTHAYIVGTIVFVSSQFVFMVKYLRESILREKQAKELEKELLQAKIKVMLSQIQPHFLFNSLLAIQQLCDENPQKAEAAVRDFSGYLRSNLDALSCSHLIPFAKELEHIQHYLALEQVDPTSCQKVIYQLGIVDFRLPALTVQPIVENAVRHGLGTKTQGGTITITTEDTLEAVVITVSDDGTGFDSSTQRQKERRHVGLKNVELRLKAQCNGYLVVHSTKDVGTTVKMIIPKGECIHERHGC